MDRDHDDEKAAYKVTEREQAARNVGLLGESAGFAGGPGFAIGSQGTDAGTRLKMALSGLPARPELHELEQRARICRDELRRLEAAIQFALDHPEASDVIDHLNNLRSLGYRV